MASDQAAYITDTDVRALAAKLKGLHALLSPGEQELLHEMLRRAAGDETADEPDVVGFAWAVDFNPFPYLDVVVDGRRKANESRKRDDGR